MLLYWWMTAVLVIGIASHLAILSFWPATLVCTLLSACVITAFAAALNFFSEEPFYWGQFFSHAVGAFVVAMMMGVFIHRRSLRHIEYDSAMMKGEQGRRRTRKLGGVVFCFGVLVLCMGIHGMLFEPAPFFLDNFKAAIAGGFVALMGFILWRARRGITSLVEWLYGERFWNK